MYILTKLFQSTKFIIRTLSFILRLPAICWPHVRQTGTSYFTKALMILLLFSVFILTNTNISAQSYDKYLSKGNKAYIAENYLSAVKFYTSATNLVEKFEPVHAKLLMNLGRSQMMIKKYKDANKNFNLCLEICKKYLDKQEKIQVKKWQTFCESQLGDASARLELYQKEVKVNIINLGKGINSIYNDYCPSFSNDDSLLIFTSTRKEATGFQQSDDGYDYEDLFISKLYNDQWQPAEKLIGTINTKGHESMASISSKDKTFYFYKYEEISNGDPKLKGGGDIFSATKNGEGWTAPKKLPKQINTKYWESHPFITDDGTSLYFVSDRPGGIGGRDIYVSHKTSSGKWEAAENLGKPVNTEHDEAAPFFKTETNMLYFSSKGHPGMGGYDIFKTVLNGENWADPINIGYPINNENDDIFFRLTPSSGGAYFSSVRKEGLGGLDLFKVEFPQPLIRFITLMEQVSFESFGVFDGHKFKFVNLSADGIKKINLIDESKVTAKKKYMIEGITLGEFDQNKIFTFKNLTNDEILKLSQMRGSNVTADRKYVVDGTVIGFWNENGEFNFVNMTAYDINKLGLIESDFQPGSSSMPREYRKIDINNDNCISVEEIYAVIDAYFDGDPSFSVVQIYKLIDYFFVQEC